MKKPLPYIAVSLFLLTSCGKTKTVELGEFSTHTDLVNQYLASEDFKSISTYADGTKELSAPKPVHINFKGEENQKYYAEISMSASFTNSKIYEFTGSYYDFYNGLIGQEYFARFNADKSKLNKAESYHFTIKDEAPRMINIEGVTNVRDIGGWKIGDKRIKQGVLYRGSGLNKTYRNETVAFFISDAGKKTLINDLGVTHELDFRMNKDVDSKNEIGSMNNDTIPEIEYTNISWNYNLLDEFETKMPDTLYQDIFSYLANEKNYPLYLHCTHGTDRTGFVCFFVEALLGLDEKSMYQDYALSNFGNLGRARDVETIATYLDTLKKYDGTTNAERAASFLKSKGITEEQITSIKKILLG
jgi:protein tyrosine/serine phosphatase